MCFLFFLNRGAANRAPETILTSIWLEKEDIFLFLNSVREVNYETSAGTGGICGRGGNPG